MGQQGNNQRQSWLSLVAETAGMSGATVARVQLQANGGRQRIPGGWVRATVQIQDELGNVVGATSWDGDARELAEGVSVDVGCDLGAGWGRHIVGWIQNDPYAVEPTRVVAPWDAATRFFEPARAMKLMLRYPTRRAISARQTAAKVAA
jgi:hypothetical protein